MRIALLANLKENAPAVEGITEDTWDDLDSMETIEQILAAHPRLTEEAIRAAIAFAAEALRADVIYPVSEKVRA